MELRVLGIPRVRAALHRIKPRLQPPKTCSRASWNQRTILLDCRSDTTCQIQSPSSSRGCFTRSFQIPEDLRLHTCQKYSMRPWEMKRRSGGDCGGSQQRAFSEVLINYIQNVMLQRDLEALPPHFPRHLLLCQFLVAEFWYRIWKRRTDLAERSAFWRFYFYVYIFIGLHFIFLLYFLLEIVILMRKSSKTFQTTISTAYLKLLEQSAEQAINSRQSKIFLNILNIGKNWVKK